MATILRLRDCTPLPVEADSISPDRFVGLRQAEVAALPILQGRRVRALGDVFEVDGDGTDEILVEGDLCHVKQIGQEMSRGQITIHGDVGLHLGARMHGGEIIIWGNAEALAGAHMTGGTIHVHGDCGAMLGGAYPGERIGMRGGVIVVDGDAGPRAGERMRRGLIAIGGSAGPFAGVRLIAGSIFVFGTLGSHAGAGMKRGTIVAMGGLADGLLPTFRYACSYSPVFLRLYLAYLRRYELPVQSEHLTGSFQRYTGDITTLGKGEILVYDQRQ